MFFEGISFTWTCGISPSFSVLSTLRSTKQNWPRTGVDVDAMLCGDHASHNTLEGGNIDKQLVTRIVHSRTKLSTYHKCFSNKSHSLTNLTISSFELELNLTLNVKLPLVWWFPWNFYCSNVNMCDVTGLEIERKSFMFVMKLPRVS